MGTARFGAPRWPPCAARCSGLLGRYEPFSEIELTNSRQTHQWILAAAATLRNRFCYGLALVEETVLLLGGLKWRATPGAHPQRVGHDLDLNQLETQLRAPWAWSGLQCAVLQLAEGGDEVREGEPEKDILDLCWA